ncbi:FecR domain-containing protein [Pedobacter sp. MC2016-14]|uniref:FecR family protein n=1 Tax=Pedobacter sp. MC2016-14 TaxID=2897327 RepID=UPI001E2AA50F|nr:FecR domain-containing protein [Pedobacter sp. MC2016-14]MCD0489209.1 FecR domain-containing protein [Pedobacter sp. MC2016-14]
MKETQNLVNLIHNYLRKELSQEESQQLKAWASSKPAYQKLLDEVSTENTLINELQTYDAMYKGDQEQVINRMLNRIHAGIQVEDLPQTKKRLSLYQWISSAAAVLLIAGMGYLFLNQNRTDIQTKTVQQIELLPGTNKATLTLANGKEIILSSKTGIIIGSKEIKYANDSLVSATSPSALSTFNTLSTPKGGQYQVTLPDGTRVWLNAATILKYPTQFNRSKRIVELQGEAYFEVNHHPFHNSRLVPFLVKTKGQEITVLGTSFNVSAYADDNSIKTTLLEGSVQILNQKSNLINRLKPGTESIVNNTQTIIRDADLASAIAWKEGLFSFRNASVEDLMKQLRRWYGVDVVFEGKIPQMRINGEVNRNMTANKVFEVLDYLDIAFRTEGNRIVIYNRK